MRNSQFHLIKTFFSRKQLVLSHKLGMNCDFTSRAYPGNAIYSMTSGHGSGIVQSSIRLNISVFYKVQSCDIYKPIVLS